MITANLNGRLGKAGVNSGGFISLAFNQYDKNAQENQITTWADIWIPPHLRDKVEKMEKGTAVIVTGELMFQEEEYNSQKRVSVTVMADNVKKYFGSNGMHFFTVRNGRLGKDPIPTKNGGRMLSIASDHFRNGEQVTSWITGFVPSENADRVDRLLKKGSSIDAVGTKMTFEISNAGYLNATMNIDAFGYGASSPKRDGGEDQKSQNKPAEPAQNEQKASAQSAPAESEYQSFDDFDSLEDFDFF